MQTGKQGYLIDWTQATDVQVAIYKSLALRNTKVMPRRLGSAEGTAIVREMMQAEMRDEPAPGGWPQGIGGWMALVVWAVRLPLLVILVASYSCMPRAWPQQVSSAHYAAVAPQSEGETEEEEEAVSYTHLTLPTICSV